jgi:hypothetical protein
MGEQMMKRDDLAIFKNDMRKHALRSLNVCC